MKKLLFLITLVVFTSCTTTNECKDALTKVNSGKYSFSEVATLMREYHIYEGKFISDKHRYKIFSKGHVTGIIHDPDCPHCYELFD